MYKSNFSMIVRAFSFRTDRVLYATYFAQLNLFLRAYTLVREVSYYYFFE